MSADETQPTSHIRREDRRPPVHNRIAEVRRQRGLLQRELADRAGVSLKTVSNMEAGLSIPVVDVALMLGRVLGVPVEELFVFNEDPITKRLPCGHATADNLFQRQDGTWAPLTHPAVEIRGRTVSDAIVWCVEHGWIALSPHQYDTLTSAYVGGTKNT